MADECCAFAPVSRRAFLRSGALALVSFGLDPLFVARAAFAREPLENVLGDVATHRLGDAGRRRRQRPPGDAAPVVEHEVVGDREHP